MSMNVLLPSDGSKSALCAAEFAAALMKRLNEIEVTILAVEDNEIIAEEVIANTKAIFDRENLAVKTVVNKGEDEVSAIIAYYGNNGPYDHVIMGRRGLSRLQDIFVGSVSQAVLHKIKGTITLVPYKKENQ